MLRLKPDRLRCRPEGMDAKAETAVHPRLPPLLRFAHVAHNPFQRVARHAPAVVLHAHGALVAVNAQFNADGVGVSAAVFVIQRLSVVEGVVHVLHQDAFGRLVAPRYLVQHQNRIGNFQVNRARRLRGKCLCRRSKHSFPPVQF